jgi:transcriptional regulator with XRE-family HTH domain
MSIEDRNLLGIYLRSLRETRGLTLRQVEAACGISNAFLSQLESGKVKQPSPSVLYKLAELYGVSYEALMEKAGYPVPESHTRSLRTAPAVFRRLGPITEEEEQALLDYLSFLRARDRREGRK